MGVKQKVRDEEELKGKKCLACLLVLLFVVGTLFAPAAAKKEEERAALDHIDEKLEALDDNSRFNNFLYEKIMSNYTPSPPGLIAVKIEIREGHWWWSKKEVKTFYVVRNDTGQCIDINDTYGGDDSELWTFYPNIGQSIDALNIITSCFEGCECESYDKAIRNFIKLFKIAIMVDKDDNVPSIVVIIANSPWLTGYLPYWAKEFLEKFEILH
jgi:hypothetical protein